MILIKTWVTVVLLIIPTAAYCQFNTVKKIKVLPQVQIDATSADAQHDNPVLLEGSNSITLDQAERQVGNMVSMPLSRPLINSSFGHRIDPLTGAERFHQGIDFQSYSDSVMSIMPGEVIKVAYSRGLGNYIEVAHGDFKTTYGHLSFVMVGEKTKVEAGTVIGITGSTGRSTGDHLHFAIKHKGRTIDPTPFLDIIYKTLELNARKKAHTANKN